MKIASYNILSGGFEKFTYNASYPTRMKLLQKAVRMIDADIIGLIETFRWTELFSPDVLKNLFGYKYVYSIQLDDPSLHKKGIDNGITVLSNIKHTSFETVRIFDRNIVKVTTAVRGIELNIFAVYLNSEKDSIRAKQVNSLLPYISQEIPTILMGDFNTFSGYDIPKDIAAGVDLIADKLSLDQLPTSTLEKIRRSNVPALLKKYGFIEANTQAEPTAPTNKLDKGLLDQFLRLDYIFYKGNVALTDFHVYTGGVFEKASDHYPISAVLQS